MSKKEIRRLWFYGSRIKGTAVESSDLDVAVDLQPNFDLADFILEKEDWLNELAPKIPFRLDIKLYEERDDCVCKQGVQDASILVYERGL